MTHNKSAHVWCWCWWVVMVMVMVMGSGGGGVQGATTPSPPTACSPEELTGYRVELAAHWSPRDFPKHYPEWRPPAQWSKMIGMSHSPQYVLFRAGEVASPALKSFAETGRSDLIDQRAQAENGVLDGFNTPPITQGVGEVTAQFFVDGNHSRVSLVSKIVPSPDWFVGVDSFDLCENGMWVDNVKIQVDPLDAGTDNGLTFTSPNWPTTPAERIFRITANYPSHPAHSFHYPTLTHLPRIATFTITKVKEYTLRHHHEGGEKDGPYEVVNHEDIAYKHYGDQSRSPLLLGTRSLTPTTTTTTATTTTTYPTATDTPLSHALAHAAQDPQLAPLLNQGTNQQGPPPPPAHSPTSRPPWSLGLGITEPGIHHSLTNLLPPPPRAGGGGEGGGRRGGRGGAFGRVSIMSNAVEDEGREGRGREGGRGSHAKGRVRIIEDPQEENQEQEIEEEEEEEDYGRIEERTRVEADAGREDVRYGVNRVHHVAQNHIPSGSAMAVIDDIVKNYQKEKRKKRRKQRRKQRREERRRRKGLKKIRPPRDCRVSEWSEWSTCSKTCGIGEQTRTRTILKHSRRGGKVCPVLEETTWCGSARACPNKIYFNWT